ncbi:hypothetical protein HanRHA438_Chr04g0191001 [Helianthus annuus]|nr:hypothetical protein HanRHA438_Chr04g0191001 [Helianthus annuus]
MNTTTRPRASFVPENEKAWEWKDFVTMIYTNDAEAREFWPNDCNLR